MNQRMMILCCTLFLIIWGQSASLAEAWRQAFNSNPPASPVKLIFIHHSTGENWLTDDKGGLGLTLNKNNYFVSDTNYGWGPEGIGDRTDIGNWWEWFNGPASSTYLAALYQESNQSGDFYSRLGTDPGGENNVIMFKSCFPNSYLSGQPSDPATTGANPLRGQDASSEYMTVANAKGIYNDLLKYFAARQDKLFILITSPPQVANDTDAAHAANARGLSNWLAKDWLRGYAYRNVAVFDFYNVLTSNGGSTNTTDLGLDAGNHHRFRNGAIQHVQSVANNMAAYPSDEWDSHPNPVGNVKATAEYIDLLNIYYNCYKGTGDCPGASGFKVDGVWKMTGGESVYFQTYQTGEAICLVSKDGKTITAYYASKMTGMVFEGGDIPTSGRSSMLRLTFSSASQATGIRTNVSTGQQDNLTLGMDSTASVNTVSDGIWQATADRSQNFYLQRYTNGGAILLLSNDAQTCEVFYDPAATPNHIAGTGMFTAQPVSIDFTITNSTTGIIVRKPGSGSASTWPVTRFSTAAADVN
ncbi:MAG: hypothetical protein HQK60_17595 [Deltaproteobacteria bacterium]|nr:hypothetical protein [Deltaproteobacteria bacterium]